MEFCPKCGARVGRRREGRPAPSCARCGAALAEGRGPARRGLAASFPFPEMRPSQGEVLEQVDQALASGNRFIILEAPVGFGKSAIAAALCRHVGSAYLLTSTKQLQDQYSADFGFPVTIGKSNFTCLVPTPTGRFLPCSKGRCEADWSLSDCPHFLSLEEYRDHEKGRCTKDSKCRRLEGNRLCPYYEQKWEAFVSGVMVANYPFFLSELGYTDDVERRRLLVCDEAHDLERQMVGFASFTLRRSQVEAYGLGGGRGGESRAFISDMGLEDASAWEGPLLEAKRAYREFEQAYLEEESMQDRVASCRAARESLDAFLDDLRERPSNWIVSSVRSTATVEGESAVDEVAFQPLEVSAYTSGLFGSADTVLLMSATVFSKETFCRTLGIPPEEAAFIRVRGSSFPVENRRIYALDTARLSKATMEASMEPLARAVDEIMTRHAGERGVVHTTSYQQARYIVEHVSEANRARLASTEGASSRSGLLRAHGSSQGSVLISPSLYQGVDLKDELSRFQVLVKVPFPDLSERRTRIKLGTDPGWYDWQTALRLVQTYGRSVRGETDHAVTYVLDSNFRPFVGRYRDLFPEYFLEAVQAGGPP